MSYNSRCKINEHKEHWTGSRKTSSYRPGNSFYAPESGLFYSSNERIKEEQFISPRSMQQGMDLRQILDKKRCSKNTLPMDCNAKSARIVQSQNISSHGLGDPFYPTWRGGIAGPYKQPRPSMKDKQKSESGFANKENLFTRSIVEQNPRKDCAKTQKISESISTTDQFGNKVRIFTDRIKRCRSLEELATLYQKEGKNFNQIQVSACYTKIIPLLREAAIYNNEIEELLTSLGKSEVFLEMFFFDWKTINSLATAAMNLSKYSRTRKCKEAQEHALSLYNKVFKEIESRFEEPYEGTDELTARVFANLANAGCELLKYGDEGDKKESRKLALNMLFPLFKQLVNAKVFHKCKPQELSNLGSVGRQVLIYGKKRIDEDAIKNALEILYRVLEIVGNLKTMNNYIGQEFSTLVSAGSVVWQYARNEKIKNAQKQDGKKEMQDLLALSERHALSAVSRMFKEFIENLEMKNFDGQGYSALAHAGMKFLGDHLDENKDLIKSAQEMLFMIFQKVVNVKLLKDFYKKDLVDLCISGKEFLRYATNKMFTYYSWGAYNALWELFKEIDKRDFNDFENEWLAFLAESLIHTRSWNNLKGGFWNDLTDALLDRTVSTVLKREFNTFYWKNICSLAWSLSMVGKFSSIDSWLAKHLSNDSWLIKHLSLENLSTENARKLYIAFLKKALDENRWEKNSDQWLCSYLKNKNFTVRFLEKVENNAIGNKDGYHLQKQVKKELEKILPNNYSIKEEYYIKPFHIDFMILDNNEKSVVPIEVNGPMHFTPNGEYTRLHQSRAEILQKMGYKVVDINYDEWNNGKDKASLLKKKLPQVFDCNFII